MFHNKHKLKCHEKETITVQNEQEKLPKKDIELCLEVEMDDEVRDIITSPDKCVSTLLDVTVIKPKDMNVDQVYTQKKILNGDEVRKLITVMELEKQGKQKLINQILANDEDSVTTPRRNNPKSAGDYVKNKQLESREKKTETPTRYKRFQFMDGRDSAVFFEQVQKLCSTDETLSDVYSDEKANVYKASIENGGHERVQQIYTTPRTYNDIKSIFTCRNKHRYENNQKPNKPCLCQNCAIVGVLTDSQKRPFVTENLYDPREFIFGKKDCKDTKAKRKKSVNFKDDSHIECHYYFKHLSAKIKDLEERLAIQEERSVPRDYFKRIITKLVAHISKITNYGSQEKFMTPKYKYKDIHVNRDATYGFASKYHVHPVLVDAKPGNVPAEKEFSRVEENIPNNEPQKSYVNPTNPPPQPFVKPTNQVQQSCTHPTNQSQQTTDGVWKWGEEILKPGIDLKNKIMVLLEDTIHSLKKPKEQLPPKAVAHTKPDVDVSPKALPKTVNDAPVRDISRKKDDSFEPSRHGRSSRHTNSISNFSEARQHDRRYKRLLPKIFSKGDLFDEEPVNISYFNPKISKWQEESLISFKFDSSDLESLRRAEERKLNETYKMEFLDTLSNTKELDKLTLWQSIWNQAKINGQNKHDKVTIQIPDRRNMKSQRIIEIEYTIAELEKLLTGKIGSQKN